MIDEALREQSNTLYHFNDMITCKHLDNLHVVSPKSTCFNRETNANSWTNRRSKSLNHVLKMLRKINEPSGSAILQLNVEDLTKSKCKVIQRIATKHSASDI